MRLAPFVLSLCALIFNPVVAQECSDTLIQIDSDRFETLEQGLVYDSDTGLMWFACTYGQSWVNEACSGTRDWMTLDQALEAAEDLVYAGYQDWRVPNINELQSIVDLSCYSPAISSELFPGVTSADYMSSSVFLNDSSAVLPMNVDFYNGRVFAMDQDFAYLIVVRQESE